MSEFDLGYIKVNFHPGDILIYRDRVYKKSWKVIYLHKHPEWKSYGICYVISTPPEDQEDLHTIMNIPEFFLHSTGTPPPP